MKKTLLGLLTVSALALAGCAKTVTRAETKAFVNDNYKGSEAKKVSIKSVLNVKKATGVYESWKDEAGEKTYESLMLPINESTVESQPDNAVFKLDGKKLEIEIEITGLDVLKYIGSYYKIPDGVNFDANYEYEVKYDESGYILKEETDVNVRFDYNETQGGISVNVTGGLVATSTTTYTY